MFVYENVNPVCKNADDCVVRAIAKAENKTWLEVFDCLLEIARQKYTMINDEIVYQEYLNSKYSRVDIGFANVKRKVMTVRQVSELDGIYIILVNEHLTTVVDHNIYDSWDCGNKHVITMWKVE